MRKLLVHKRLKSTQSDRFFKVDVIREALDILFGSSVDDRNFYNMADLLV